MDYIWQCSSNDFLTIENWYADQKCLHKNNGQPCEYLRKIGVDS